MEDAMSCQAAGDRPNRAVRRVLAGVPRISLWAEPGQRPESLAFPTALRACLQYLGADPAHDYAYHLGTSGTAFGLLWHTQRWSYTGDLSDLAVTSAWHEPIRRAFAATGYAHEVLAKGDGVDEATYRRRIAASIDAGRPVMAAGVVGPPACGIITGYDAGGDVLTGWSLFQAFAGHGPAPEFEPCGYFRKRGWYADTGNLILIGDRGAPPPPRQAYRDALAWAVEVMRTPRLADRHCGLSAYAAWAADMGRDEDFPDDEQVLLERLDCHFAALSSLAEGRWYAAEFLRRAAAGAGLGAELEAAAAACDAETALMAQAADLQGGWDPHDPRIARTLARAGVRRRICALILQARDSCARVAAHIERALAG